MSDRETLLATAYQAYTQGLGGYDTSMLPKKDFAALVEENIGNLSARPDPARGTQVLQNWRDEDWEQKFEQEKDPDLRAKYFGIWKALRYVPFEDEFLPQFAHVVEEGLRLMLQDTPDPSTTLTCLALRGMRVSKSNMWFAAWAWAYIPQLRELVDFVIPSLHVLVFFMDHLPLAWRQRVNVLYLDDMMYSGTQFNGFRWSLNERERVHDVKKLYARNQTDTFKIHIFPLIAYMGEAAVKTVSEIPDSTASFGITRVIVHSRMPTFHVLSPMFWILEVYNKNQFLHKGRPYVPKEGFSYDDLRDGVRFSTSLHMFH
jgi:hypothetical protein